MSAVLFFFLTVLGTNSPQTPAGDTNSTFEQTAKQAETARTSNRLNNAITFYSQGVRMRPSWSEGWWWLGSLLYEQDRFAEASTAFQRFIAIAPKPAPGYAFLALSEYETHKYDAALRHFEDWKRRGSPGTDELLDVGGFHWALLLTQRGQFTEALYLLAAKARKRGESPALIEAMGLASLRMRNLPEDYNPEKREPVWLAGKAAFYAEMQDNPRADEYAAKLLKHYEHEPNVHFFCGTLFGFENERDPAAKEYLQELQRSPDHVAAMIELALVYIDDHQYSEALPLAERAVALEPQSGRAHYAFGKALLKTDRAQEGAHQLEIAKQLAPSSSMIRFALAASYKALGRRADAERELTAFGALKEKETPPPPEREKLRKQDSPGPSE